MKRFFPLLAFLAACGSADKPTAPSTPAATVPGPAPELGNGDHSAASVDLVEIASSAVGLKSPRDLAFNPLVPDQLWVVDLADESVVIVTNASTDARSAERRKDGYALHFMANPAAIDFGASATTIGVPGTFATCGESRNTYDNKKPQNDFMGPTLWSSDLTVFAEKNPNGLGSHLDMLHQSPLCMGISHESANRFWVFEGLSGSIGHYDFLKDNGIGNDDHSDGEYWRYAKGQVKYAKGVPSGLFYRATDAMLYIADSGNSRIAKLDTKSGTKGSAVPAMEPMASSYAMNGAVIADVVPASSGLVKVPSGLEIHNDVLYVSDNATGRLSAFSLAGEQVNYLDTGLPAGSLGGMAFGPDGKLYFVDMVGNRVLRVDPKP